MLGLIGSWGEDLAVPEPSGHLFVTESCLAFPKFSFFQSLVLGLAESRCDSGVMPVIQMWSADAFLSTSWTLLSRCWLFPKDGEQTAIFSLFLEHLNTAASRIEDYSSPTAHLISSPLGFSMPLLSFSLFC